MDHRNVDGELLTKQRQQRTIHAVGSGSETPRGPFWTCRQSQLVRADRGSMQHCPGGFEDLMGQFVAPVSRGLVDLAV
jgi:hypothetical protein